MVTVAVDEAAISFWTGNVATTVGLCADAVALKPKSRSRSTIQVVIPERFMVVSLAVRTLQKNVASDRTFERFTSRKAGKGRYRGKIG